MIIDKMNKISGIMRDTTFRISRLIDNMFDFATGRLGEGIVLSIDFFNLETKVQNLMSEMKGGVARKKFTSAYSIVPFGIL